MAKSEGNFRTIREVLNEAPGEAARLMMLKTHYRQPLDWTSEGLREAKTNLDRWYRVLETSNEVPSERQHRDLANPTSVALNVTAALEDDLNTPEVFTAMSDIADEAFRAQQKGELEDFCHLADELQETGKLLGLLQSDPVAWRKGQIFVISAVGLVHGKSKVSGIGQVSEQWIEGQIAARNAARKAKNFAEADRIRTELALKGILLEDGPQGTSWRRAG